MAEGAVVRFDGLERREDLRRDAWHGVHMARYRFALEHVGGRRLLDVACGTGYGLPLLRRRASFVIGSDLDRRAVLRARSAGGAGLLVADGCRLPFAPASFDAVTSFETLEHVEDRSRFVAELRRVLREDGVLVLSTPNALYTEPIDGKPRNPHHLHEYRPRELREELAAHFNEVTLFGQTLHHRIRISPFRDDQRRLPWTPGAQARRLLWRLLYRLPPSIHDPVSDRIWGHPLVAGEGDYEFRVDAVEEAPVLVALCRPRSEPR